MCVCVSECVHACVCVCLVDGIILMVKSVCRTVQSKMLRLHGESIVVRRR